VFFRHHLHGKLTIVFAEVETGMTKCMRQAYEKLQKSDAMKELAEMGIQFEVEEVLITGLIFRVLFLFAKE